MQSWADGAHDVLTVMPTGSGKTVLFCDIVKDQDSPSVILAHRQELVGQACLTLARNGIYHRVESGNRKLMRFISDEQRRQIGRSYYDPNACVTVAGVDTLIRRDVSSWADSVGLVVIDEAHHTLTANKWGKSRRIFKNARGLHVTATPSRTDGKGLGRDHGGFIDNMIIGPSMRDLIDRDRLSDYVIYAPPPHADFSGVKVTKSGDYNALGLADVTRKSHIYGDIVPHYLKHAAGKRGITFVPDVGMAYDIADEYRSAGVPAIALDGETDGETRIQALDDLRTGKLLQIVNVDLLGEGTDIPAIEVVSMARKTESFILYCQQFGRALRLMDGKAHAIIIDHVGNVVRHGLPDASRAWSLGSDKSTPRAVNPDDTIPLQSCPDCTKPFKITASICPHCGFVISTTPRTAPEIVNGDLIALTPEVLAQMRGEADRITESPDSVRDRMLASGAPRIVANSAAKQHERRLNSQEILRETIAQWAGCENATGYDRREQYRRFFTFFGIDVLSAQALGKSEAEKLTFKIQEAMKCEIKY